MGHLRFAARAATLALGSALVAAQAASAGGGGPLPDKTRKAVLNDTGVVVCRDPVTGADLDSCTGTGQDGEFGRDITHPKSGNGLYGFNFGKVCNNGHMAGTQGCPKPAPWGAEPRQWGCTFDHVTGLLWELRTEDGSIRDQSRTFSNEGDDQSTDASGLLDALNRMAVCGVTDWRLPTTVELFGLTAQADAGVGGYLDTDWFPDTVGVVGWIWTSDAAVTAPGRLWVVKFGDATTGVNNESGVDFPTGVRAVSGPTAGANPRFVPKGDEVRDTATGLVWRRCVEGMTWDGQASCVGDDQRYVWGDALAHAEQVARTTGQGWRLPNVKEMQSLIEPGQTQLIDPVFPQSPRFLHWTSTWGGSDDPNTLDFSSGIVQGSNAADLQTPLNIRLVRNAN